MQARQRKCQSRVVFRPLGTVCSCQCTPGTTSSKIQSLQFAHRSPIFPEEFLTFSGSKCFKASDLKMNFWPILGQCLIRHQTTYDCANILANSDPDHVWKLWIYNVYSIVLLPDSIYNSSTSECNRRVSKIQLETHHRSQIELTSAANKKRISGNEHRGVHTHRHACRPCRYDLEEKPHKPNL